MLSELTSFPARTCAPLALQYAGWYHQPYDENISAYVSGAYEDVVCCGDTALIMAVKTGDISVVSCILEFKPNIEITNIDGMRAADYARRNGLKDLLNDDGAPPLVRCTLLQNLL
jgi:hypothetical protein